VLHGDLRQSRQGWVPRQSLGTSQLFRLVHLAQFAALLRSITVFRHDHGTSIKSGALPVGPPLWQDWDHVGNANRETGSRDSVSKRCQRRRSSN